MNPFSLRWIASVAAILAAGAVFAAWIIRTQPVVPVNTAPDEPFALANKLTDDGRIGKITDVQGIVSIKPVLAERWSPAPAQLVLKPGDWLRTDSRGANAASIKLLPGASVVVGPHSTVELTKANELHLVAGEIEVTASADAPIELRGPDRQTLKIDGKQFVRLEKEKLVRVEKAPLWLQGFLGTAANETLGSLIATVDGRNVPLTVGYHRVTVDIRDQIARTVIEESFVNRTDAVLEGVFHFPLPADASISGFGMWIGDRLVEADVVEKQRAREIYETILREKRDPGLLEWAGGNIFKARVYPIPARSEKRIKISYTQVLPLHGNRYRYGYALQSDLLKQHPLRELSIDVKVNSASAIKAVTSPTHDTRSSSTGHSGHVEFAAQEYTPTRDFEVVVELAGRPADVAVISHRRGDDGYFLVQLTPPGGLGGWERPLIPNGDPLKLVILADTSASMDRGQRAAQNAILATLLGALTPKDTIQVAAFDVNCDWLFEKPVPATPENIALVREALAKRLSLGWTNLDNAFTSAITKCEPGSHAVYLGDGISTSGDADPVAFAKRLAKLHEGKSGTFHAVALGSSYEPAAMKAIAALGGGSFRRVSGESGPAAIALDLLTEIATPTLRNAKVEITGVRTARVYPEELPNIAAGSQQILLGRYLPEGKDQRGEIVVTGMLGSKAVRYTTPFDLKDAEQGNSFLPRLWARMHLDKLLEQGNSPAIQRDVIALSEEFNIITPHTSLLVLETDADRERFAVKRRFQMRDGEKFFAAGRDNAVYELKQKQMRLAGDYRTALRRQVLAQLQSAGRNPQMFAGPQKYLRAAATSSLPESRTDLLMYFGNGDHSPTGESLGRFHDGEREEYFLREKLPGLGANEPRGGDNEWGSLSDGGKREKFEVLELPFSGLPADFAKSLSDEESPLAARFADPEYSGRGVELQLGLPDSGKDHLSLLGYGYTSYGYSPSNLPWLEYYFPNLPAPARGPKEAKSTWPAGAIELSKSLLRTEKLAKQMGGSVLNHKLEYFDSRSGEVTQLVNRTEMVSPKAWLVKSAPAGGPVTLDWCDARERGAIQTAYQLGRLRASNAFDLQQPPLELADQSTAPLHERYTGYTATVETIAKDRALLTLRVKSQPKLEIRYLIDTDRHVVLSEEHLHRGKTNRMTQFGDFAEIAGSWWARKIEHFGADGKRNSLRTLTLAELSAEEFTKRMTEELKAKEPVLFLKQPLPSVTQAKAAVVAGKATFDDRAVLTLHFATTQQWTRATEHLAECERLAQDRSGMRWLKTAYYQTSRQHEVLRKQLMAEAKNLNSGTSAESKANAYFLAQQLFDLGQQSLSAGEQLALADELAKIAADQPAHLHAVKYARNQRVTLLSNAGKSEEALALAKALATEFAADAGLQYQYAQRLAQTGDTDAALAWLTAALARKWDVSPGDTLRELTSNLLRIRGRVTEQVEFLAKWIAAKPETETPYAHYLAALVRSNRAAKAEELVAQWLVDGRVNGEMPSPVYAMLRAALAFARGQAFQLYSNRLDERWHTALADTALFFARGEDEYGIAHTILSDYRFTYTDVCKATKKTLGGEFLKGIAAFPADRLTAMINWVWSDDSLTTEEWLTIAAELRKRWDAEKDTETKHRLGQGLIQVLHRFSGDDDLQFLRVQFQTAPAEYRAAYANAYFQALIVRPWTAELETELFKLLDALAPIDELADGLFTRVQTLHRLTDAMVEARYQAAFKKVEHPDKLTRTELAKKQTELRKRAREGFAERLKAEAAKRAKPFSAWVTIERHWLDVQLEREFPAIAAELWPILDAPAALVDADDANAALLRAFDTALRDRARATLANLAARKGADPKLIERLTKHLDAQIAAHPDEPRWKREKFQLMIALDQTKELEAELRRWIALPDSDNRWRLALGRLLAEQGKVVEAIPLFEAVQTADELGPDEYRTLAEWYQIENRRELAEKAKSAQFKTTDENLLLRQLNNHLYRIQNANGRSSVTVEPEILELLRAFFEKSQSPQSGLSNLGGLYKSTRDFSLLAVLPDAIVGHSAGSVYPFLLSLRSILGDIRDEATADELAQRIAAVRALRTTAVDLRALDLLEVQVERRAAELQNQPGPHAEKALAALKRASVRDWADGEPRRMAEFLADLGDVKDSSLAKEQRTQLETLHRTAKPGTFDRLQIARYLSDVQSSSGQTPLAIDTLEAALKEFETAHAGKLPSSANDDLERFLGRLENAGQFERGEKYLRNQLAHPIHAEQRTWLIRRLNQLYRAALRNRGAVSLGTGETLYKALAAKLIADIGAAEPGQRYPLLAQLASTYRVGHELKFTGAVGDLRAFAFEKLPALLKDDTEQYEETVTEFSEVLHSLAGPRLAIQFVLDRAEATPDWVRYSQQQTPWRLYCDRLGRWRTEVKDLREQEARLLKFVEAELRRDLRSRESTNRMIYSSRSNHYWREKDAPFAAVAEEALIERRGSSASVEYIADYFFYGLEREKRAIEILSAAHADKRLADSGVWQLVDYLHRSKRFAESIPPLLGLLERNPESLAYRTRLMHAYFNTDKPVELSDLLKRTDAYFHEKDRWNEAALAALAESTLENRLFAQSVAYCEELIPLHQRTHSARGDRALHRFYTNAADAYAGLGKTKEAVDRASAAIVTWPAGHYERKEALDQLVRILQNAPKLAEFIAELDAEKLQSAVVRKALGRALVAKNEHARAIPQFRLAAELQPNDAEVYPLLVACFDKIGDKEGAVKQLYDAVELTRREGSLYADLARRLAELNRPGEAERANTSIVELQANESESHALLAEIREKQNRWPEAIGHWERVAEIRKLEPTGLLKLGAAQLHEKQWKSAAESLRKLRMQTWPDRFPEVIKQTRELEKALELQSKQ